MVEGVVADAVSGIHHLLEYLRIFPDVIPHHEECGLNAIVGKNLQNEWCSLGDGTVVEGQINCLLMTVHSPCGSWIKPAQEYCWLLDNHP